MGDISLISEVTMPDHDKWYQSRSDPDGSVISMSEPRCGPDKSMEKMLAMAEKMLTQLGWIADQLPEFLGDGLSTSMDKSSGSTALPYEQKVQSSQGMGSIFPRVEFPIFDGENPSAWIKESHKYFQIVNTLPEEHKVLVASIYFRGKAEVWFRSYSEGHDDITWDQLTTAVLERFDQEVCEDFVTTGCGLNEENFMVKRATKHVEAQVFDEMPEREVRDLLESETGDMMLDDKYVFEEKESMAKEIYYDVFEVPEDKIAKNMMEEFGIGVLIETLTDGNNQIARVVATNEIKINCPFIGGMNFPYCEFDHPFTEFKIDPGGWCSDLLKGMPVESSYRGWDIRTKEVSELLQIWQIDTRVLGTIAIEHNKDSDEVVAAVLEDIITFFSERSTSSILLACSISAGYYVETLGFPFTCFDANQYGTLLLGDLEDEYCDEEIRKLKDDVIYNGISLTVFADWYNVDSMKKMKFPNDNIRSWWTPVTGGSNVPALNDFLAPFGIAFGDKILNGDFVINGEQSQYATGTDIVKFLKGGYLHSFPFLDSSESSASQNVLLSGLSKADSPNLGLAEIGSGRITVYGDSNCLDSSHMVTNCYWLLKKILDFTGLNIRDPMLFSDSNRQDKLHVDDSQLPSHRTDVNFSTYSAVAGKEFICRSDSRFEAWGTKGYDLHVRGRNRRLPGYASIDLGRGLLNSSAREITPVRKFKLVEKQQYGNSLGNNIYGFDMSYILKQSIPEFLVDTLEHNQNFTSCQLLKTMSNFMVASEGIYFIASRKLLAECNRDSWLMFGDHFQNKLISCFFFSIGWNMSILWECFIQPSRLVMYSDLFLERRSIYYGKLWNIRWFSIACFSSAVEMEEWDFFVFSEYQIHEYNFEGETIQKMESLVLSTLEWKMSGATPLAHLNYFIKKLCGELRDKELSNSEIELIMALMRGINVTEHRVPLIAAAAVLGAYDCKLTEALLEIKMDAIQLLGSLGKLLLKFSQNEKFVCDEADMALSSMVKYIALLPLLRELGSCHGHSNIRVRVKVTISISNCISRRDLKSIQEFGLDSLIKMTLNLLNDKFPDAREETRGIAVSLDATFTEGEEENKLERWQGFCQTNLPTTHAQAMDQLLGTIFERCFHGSLRTRMFSTGEKCHDQNIDSRVFLGYKVEKEDSIGKGAKTCKIRESVYIMFNTFLMYYRLNRLLCGFWTTGNK